MVESAARRQQVLGVLGIVFACALLAIAGIGRMQQRSSRMELAGSVDWDEVPSVRPLPADWAGVPNEEGEVVPATCGQICGLCSRGALRGSEEPGAFMEGESCQLCACERYALPVWDSWNSFGECSPELCFACESGRLEGAPCLHCGCGAFAGNKHLEDVCRHRDQVCYSCMVGTLMGGSCERCMCGWWEGGRREAGETRFGAHECATTCRKCSIGEEDGVDCDMCFCPVYESATAPEVYVPKGKGIADHVGELQKSLQRAKDELEEHVKALGAKETPAMPPPPSDVGAGEEEQEEVQQPSALPHYSWMKR